MAHIATPEKTHMTLRLRLEQMIHEMEHGEHSREEKKATPLSGQHVALGKAALGACSESSTN